MDISFLNVLNASISASWLVLLVLGLRLVLKKAPKAIHCALWALVAIRLLCPVSIQSPVSLMPSSQTISPDYLYEPAVHSTAQTVLEIVDNPVYPEPVRVVLDTSVSRVSVWDIQWSLVWIAGVGIMGLYALISWLRLRRRVSASILIGSNIRLCDYIDSPFILGIMRPLIYLPSDMDQETMEHVLAHEQAHLTRRDHWWKPLGFGLLSIHWFNPLMWVAYILLCRDIELACDERVIRDLTSDRKKAYSAALLRCSVSRHQIAACPLAFGETGVKERVKNVLNYKKPAFWVIFLAILLCAAVAVCFLTDPLSQEEPVPLPVELENGTWVAQEKVHWPSYSSLFVYKMEMEVQGAALMLRFNEGEWTEGPLSVENDWQEECPIDESYRKKISIKPSFGITDLSDCYFLVLDENHFLVQRFGNLYVVAWKPSDIGLEIIDYIFHVVPESKAPAGGVKVIPETGSPTETLIRQTILNFNHIDFPDPYYAAVSFHPVATALSDGPDGPQEQIYAAARIGLFRQSEGVAEEFTSRIFMFAISILTQADGSPRASSYWQSNLHSLGDLSPEFTLPVVNTNDAGKYEDILAADCREQMEAYLQRCSVTIDLGTTTPAPDPMDEAIDQYFLEHCIMASEENTYTGISFRNRGTAYRNPDAPAPITSYLSVRIAHFTQNPDGSVTESSGETFSAIFYLNENPDGSYAVAECVRDDAKYDSDNLVLETECWRQAYSYFQPTLQSEIKAIGRNHPEYLKKDTTNGLDLVWWNTPEGVRCVVLSGLQRARNASDAIIHTPLTIQETIAVLQVYKIPVSAMLTFSSSTLGIYQIDSP